MTLEESKEMIYNAFIMSSKRNINFAYQLTELILDQNEESQAFLFQYVCENWGILESSNEIATPELISESKYKKYELLYGQMVDGTLLSYIRLGQLNNWERNEFYKQLWMNISSNTLWKNKEERSFVVYYIAIDSRSPYFNIGSGLKMSNDDYSHLQEEVFEKIQKFHFVDSLEYEQKTEKASLIYNLIEELETFEQKAVLMSHIISSYDDKAERLIRRLRGELI